MRKKIRVVENFIHGINGNHAKRGTRTDGKDKGARGGESLDGSVREEMIFNQWMNVESQEVIKGAEKSVPVSRISRTD